MKVICAVKDRAVDAFGQPFFVRHENEALRSFTTEVNRNGSEFNSHPGDYDLYVLGTYDEQSGRVSPGDNARLLVLGQSVYVKEN